MRVASVLNLPPQKEKTTFVTYPTTGYT